MKYLIITVVIIGFVYMRWGSTILRYIRILSPRESFSKNPISSCLSKEQKQAIALGQIISEQNKFYCDSLDTGAFDSEQEIRLREHWGIYSPQTAISVISRFATDGVHKLHNEAIRVYHKVLKEEWKAYIDSHFETSMGEEIYDYVQKIDSAISFLEDVKVVSSEEKDSVLKQGTIAWDIGRIVYLARASFMLNYINEEQAWDIINSQLVIAKQHFSSWKSFGQSYLLGRSFWSVDDLSIVGLCHIHKDSIVDEKSPWMQFPL